MTAPLPDLTPSRGDRFAETFKPRDVIYIKERDQHIPSWYDPSIHPNPGEIVVTSGGLPLKPFAAPAEGWRSFTVGEVLPENRWAIQASGEILPQHEFEQKYRLKLEEFYRLQGKAYPGSVLREYVPQVAKYVAFTVDRNGKATPIGYEPHPKNAKPSKALYDVAEDKVVDGDERLDLLVRCYRDKALRPRLKPHELEEVEAHLGIAKGDALVRAIAEGAVSADELRAALAKLEGEKPPASLALPKAEKKPRKGPQPREMKCGASVYPIHQKRHVAGCEVCRA